MRKLLSAFIVLSTISCTTRINRPFIAGYIYDSITLKPLNNIAIETWDKTSEGFKVEVMSNSEGYFFLLQQKYLDRFVFPGKEAPPAFFSLIIKNPNYETKTIEDGRRYGYASTDTTRYDTIFLKPIKNTLPSKQ